jgi:hypothetical protein
MAAGVTTSVYEGLRFWAIQHTRQKSADLFISKVWRKENTLEPG